MLPTATRSTKLMDEIDQQIDQLLFDGKPRAFYCQDQKYWLKTAGDEKNNLIRQFSCWLAKRPALSFFRVNSIMDSADRLKLEAQHLQLMHDAGMPVPALITQGDGYLVIPDCGTVLSTSCAQWSAIDVQTIMQQAFRHLAMLHQAGFYHGRPALRDMVHSEQGKLTFIDLEESGVDKNPLLMARDIFLLLMECNALPQMKCQQQLACIEIWAQNAPVAANAELYNICRILHKLVPIAKAILRYKPGNKAANAYLSALHVLQKSDTRR